MQVSNLKIGWRHSIVFSFTCRHETSAIVIKNKTKTDDEVLYTCPILLEVFTLVQISSFIGKKIKENFTTVNRTTYDVFRFTQNSTNIPSSLLISLLSKYCGSQTLAECPGVPHLNFSESRVSLSKVEGASDARSFGSICPSHGVLIRL